MTISHISPAMRREWCWNDGECYLSGVMKIVIRVTRVPVARSSRQGFRRNGAIKYEEPEYRQDIQ